MKQRVVLLFLLLLALGAMPASAQVNPIPISYGQTVTGEATNLSAPVIYSFTGSAGDNITIISVSESVDTFLQLADAQGNIIAENDDRAAGDFNAEISFTLTADGTYLIGASAYTQGSFTLTLTLNNGSGTTSAPVSQQAGTPSDPLPIAYGQTVAGQATNIQQFVFYGFTGTAGDEIIVTATSTSVDTYLQFGDANANLIAENDDRAEGDTNAEIIVTLEADGQYLLAVAGYTAGPYELSLAINAGTTSMGSAPQQDAPPVTQPNPQTAENMVNYGQAVQGEAINLETPVSYTFNGTAGDDIIITATSELVDTVLALRDPSGNVIAQNDDRTPSDLNAQISTTIPANGIYTVDVTAYRAGPFTLTLTQTNTTTTEASPPPQESTSEPQQTVTITPISYGQTVTGTATNLREPVIYSFTGTAGDAVVIEASSSAIDTYLVLADASGDVLAENDDISTGNLNSLISLNLPATGEYLIGVSGYTEGEFMLALVQEGTDTVPVTDQQTQTVGDVQTGEITNDQPFFQIPLTNVPAGAEITIDVRATSGDLDPYAALLFGEDILAENDDREQGNLNPRIVFPNASAGDYTVVITRYRFEEGSTTGSFEVAIDISAGSGAVVVAPPPTTTVDPVANGYPALSPAAPADWTILAYLGGDNNLEDALVTDLNEFELGGGSTEKVRILVLLDRHPDYDTSNDDWSEVRVYEVIPDVSNDHGVSIPTIDTVPIANLGELDTGFSNNLTDFLVWGMSNYPASNYAVVLNNHGAGWAGIVTDDTSRSILSIPDLQESFSNALQATGVDKFALLVNDACLMSSVEFYAGMAPYFDYVIGSPEITFNPGFDMELMTRAITDNTSITPADLGAQIVDKFMVDMEVGLSDYLPIIGLAVTDLRDFDPVVTAVNNFANVVNANPAAYASLIGEARSNTYTYSFFLPEEEWGPATQIDLGHFMRQVMSGSNDPALTSAAQTVLDELNRIRIYARAGEHLGNFTSYYNIYFPERSGDFTPVYLQQSPLAAWGEMLRGYFNALSPRGIRSAGAPISAPAGPAISPATATSVVPSVTVTNVFPAETSIDFPTIVAMEVVGRNISEVGFTVDQIQPDGTAIRVDVSNIVIETVVDGVVDYVNEWDSGVNEINFTWEVNLSLVQDGASSNFEAVNFAQDGGSSLAGRYQFPGSDTWQDVTVMFDDDGNTARVIARTTTDLTAIADVQLAPGGIFQANRSVVTPDGRVNVIPGNTYVWPENGISWVEAPAPSGQYNLGFLAEAFGGTTGFDAATVTVANDSVGADTRGYVDYDWGFRLLHPNEWFDVSYFPDPDWLQTSNLDATEYMFVYPVYETTGDLQEIAQTVLDRYSLAADGAFTPITVGGQEALEFTFTYSVDEQNFSARSFATYIPSLELGLVFSTETVDGLNLEPLYALMRDNLTFFDISSVRAEDVGFWQTEFYGSNSEITFPVPIDWMYIEGDFWNFYTPDEPNAEGIVYRAAAYSVIEGTDAGAVTQQLLDEYVIPFSPQFEPLSTTTYYGENYTWVTEIYRYEGDLGTVEGRMHITIIDGLAYAFWFEAPQAEAAELARVYDTMLDGFFIAEVAE